MHYDSTRDGLYRPYTRPPLDAGLFAGKRDALCAELSRLAYFAFPPRTSALPQALADHGLGEIACFEDVSTHTQAIAGMDGSRTAFIAFRGTQSGIENIVDLIIDLKAWHLNWDGPGKIHTGFGEAYCGKPGSGEVPVRKQVRDWIAAAGPARLVLTGHSLGAALATLCAIDHPAAELVTIGSPRVGNADFVAAFAGRNARRYVDCCDAVTLVPPPVGYRHVGDAIYIDRNGRVHDPAPGNLQIGADRAKARLDYVPLAMAGWNNVNLRDLADHAPVNYVSAMLGIREPV